MKQNEEKPVVNVHEAHRRRMKQRFLTEGIDGFADHEVLEMLLFYSIPRYNTNEIAHQLINEFGSLSAVFEADAAALKTVPGIGEESSCFIKFITSVCRRYEIDRQREVELILDGHDAAKVMRPYFIGENEELFLVLLVDNCSRLRKVSIIDRGNEDSVFVNVNRVVKTAVNNHASGIYIAHSHPNGFAVPSKADREITVILAQKLRAINIAVHDHLIFSKTDVCFLSEDKQMKNTGVFTVR